MSVSLSYYLLFTNIISLSPPVLPVLGSEGSDSGPPPSVPRESTPFPVPELVGSGTDNPPGQLSRTQPTTPTKQEEENGWGDVIATGPTSPVRGRPTQPSTRGGNAVRGGRPVRRSSRLTFLSTGRGMSSPKYCYKVRKLKTIKGGLPGSPVRESRPLPRPPTPITSRVPTPASGQS